MWPDTLPGTWVSRPMHSESPAVNENVIRSAPSPGIRSGNVARRSGAILVVPWHEPGPVVPRPQDVAHRLVGDRQIVVRVIPGDDEVVDVARRAARRGRPPPAAARGWDLVEASVGILVEVQVGQLDDAGQGHVAAVCTNRLSGRRHQGARPSARRPGGRRPRSPRRLPRRRVTAPDRRTSPCRCSGPGRAGRGRPACRRDPPPVGEPEAVGRAGGEARDRLLDRQQPVLDREAAEEARRRGVEARMRPRAEDAVRADELERMAAIVRTASSEA